MGRAIIKYQQERREQKAREPKTSGGVEATRDLNVEHQRDRRMLGVKEIKPERPD